MGTAADDQQPRALVADRRSVPHGREPEVTLTPAGRGGHPRGRDLRVVGPGRREREYQERIGALEGSLDGLNRALDEASLVARGTGRIADRLEAELAAARTRETEARQQLHRTLVLLGSAQHEVEGLRAVLASASRKALAAAVEPRPTWFARLLGRTRR
jgi:hypothetical protein